MIRSKTEGGGDGEGARSRKGPERAAGGGGVGGREPREAWERESLFLNILRPL